MSTSESISSDFLGRINNISLAPNADNSLAPLYEAITNAFQAIEDKFDSENLSKGKIRIEVMRDSSQTSKPTGFIVSDNGIGINKLNYESFTKMDSRLKYKRGGKGVGRLLWLKVFKKAKVESYFDHTSKINFEFVCQETNQISKLIHSDVENKSSGTTITLHPFNPEFENRCHTKPETIKNKIISHFLSYFINIHVPEIILVDQDIETNLFDYFSNSYTRDKRYKFTYNYNEQEYAFILHSFLLPKEFSDDEKGNNALFYGANGRSVSRVELDGALGLKKIDNDYVYFGYIESEFQDKISNQERTILNWPDRVFDEINKNAIEYSKDFLKVQIEKIRKQQSNKIRELRNEHPRFISIAKDPEEIAEKLQLSTQSPEDIYIELSRHSRREYKQKQRAFNEAKRKKLPDIEQKAKDYTSELKSESISSLAEYILKRKLIIEVFEDSLKYTDIKDQKHAYEEAVHEIICPLRETTDTLNYEDHNLWIIDDNLAFYTYFNSDKTLTSITGGTTKSTKEPDLTFFDLGLGFNNNGSNDPVTIIEFKRPGRDDYTAAKNPISQIREYVDKLRQAGKIKANSGSELRTINDDTPFMGYIIADIEPTLKKVMKDQGQYKQKAGHGSYYYWDDQYKIFMEISSYAEILKNAKSRHHKFFERLGIET